MSGTKKVMILVLIGLLIFSFGCTGGEKEISPNNIPNKQGSNADGKDINGKIIHTTIEIVKVGYCKPNAVFVIVKNTGEYSLNYPATFIGNTRCSHTGPYAGFFAAGDLIELSCPGTGYELKEGYENGETYYIKMEAVENSPSFVCDFETEDFDPVD